MIISGCLHSLRYLGGTGAYHGTHVQARGQLFGNWYSLPPTLCFGDKSLVSVLWNYRHTPLLGKISLRCVTCRGRRKDRHVWKAERIIGGEKEEKGEQEKEERRTLGVNHRIKSKERYVDSRKVKSPEAKGRRDNLRKVD